MQEGLGCLKRFVETHHVVAGHLHWGKTKRHASCERTPNTLKVVRPTNTLTCARKSKYAAVRAQRFSNVYFLFTFALADAASSSLPVSCIPALSSRASSLPQEGSIVAQQSSIVYAANCWYCKVEKYVTPSQTLTVG